MAKFIFKVGEKIATGITQRVPDVIEKTFQSSSRCPYCNNRFTTHSRPGQNRTVGEIETALRGMMRRHYDNIHNVKE